MTQNEMLYTSIRVEFEKLEEINLSKRACLAINSKGRARKENECFIRTCFQRDRDRILHSEAFRRLKHKTQVFLSPSNDHFRTRLTHTLEVVGIARTIARALRLNEDLTEAIALGHDLGHTPFGHAGEQVLAEISEEGFHHASHGVRVVSVLEKNGAGLNLTFEVIDGIAKHSKGKKGNITGDKDAPATLEGQIVRISDLVAYINHDIDDAIRAGIIREDSLPKLPIKLIGDRYSKRIHKMVIDIIAASKESEFITMSSQMLEATEELRDYLYSKVYPAIELDGATERAKRLLRQLAQWFIENPSELYKRLKHPPPPHQSFNRTLIDYLASMTDGYAIRIFNEIFIPNYISSSNLAKLDRILNI